MAIADFIFILALPSGMKIKQSASVPLKTALPVKHQIPKHESKRFNENNQAQ